MDIYWTSNKKERRRSVQAISLYYYFQTTALMYKFILTNGQFSSHLLFNKKKNCCAAEGNEIFLCKTFENIMFVYWKDSQLFLFLSHCGAYSTWPMDRSVYICWAAEGNGRLRGLGQFLSLRWENNSNNKTGDNINRQNMFGGLNHI